jgi:hypothetical protein
MAKTVVGVFDTEEAAKQAVEALVRAGISRSDISLVAADARGEYARRAPGEEGDDRGDRATTGAAGGAVLGGVLGLLAGMTTLAIPGIGPIIAAGPIAAALTGTALGAGVGAATGGLIGYLTGAGVPEEEAGYYAEAVHRGGTLVTVHASDAEADRAVRILDESGARDIEEMAAEWRRGGWTGAEAGALAGAGEQPRPAIPVVREEVQVGERAGQRGGVRVYPRVTPEPVTEPTEEPVAAKRALVIEEVVVDLDVQARTETVRDRVRRSQVEVDRTGTTRAGAAGYGAFEADFRQHCARAFTGGELTYEDCAPAYRYGHTLGSDTRFTSRDWPALEADARERWEARNPGTWERFKNAIRYAWDRARGQARAA